MSTTPNEKAEEQSGPTEPDVLLAKLGDLGIDYQNHEHEAAFTVEESRHLHDTIPGCHCKNLFLRDHKKNMWLVVADADRKIDLKALQPIIGSGRLSFGSAERLWDVLGVKPGSVTPFALINDRERKVQVILDRKMMDSDFVNYHPLVNTMTVTLTPQDLLKFIEDCGHTYDYIDFTGVGTR